MRDYIESLMAYIKAVLRYWVAIVGGAVVAVVGVVATELVGIDVPRLVWIGVFVLGFPLAQFLAFHHKSLDPAPGPPMQITVIGDPTFNFNGGGGAEEAVVVQDPAAVAMLPPTQHDEQGED